MTPYLIAKQQQSYASGKYSVRKLLKWDQDISICIFYMY